MFEVRGKYTSAKIFANFVEETAMSQIYNILNQSMFKDAKIAIMCDVHAGASDGGPIGFTAQVDNVVIPSLIGVDISCGMYNVKLGNITFDFQGLDDFIRKNIPFGTGGMNESMDKSITDKAFINSISTICKKIDLEESKAFRSLGSLGSGNHFFSIDVDDETNEKYLTVHTGSRKFGYDVCNYHQKKAKEYCKDKSEKIDNSLCYLENEGRDEYIKDMLVASKYANLNRLIIINRILSHLGIKLDDAEHFETVHNYISVEDNIIRKGAISAKEGEKVLIPLDMKSGCLIGIGKGNEDWNFSAPHGAGRLMARNQAKRNLDLEDFKKDMEGIWCSSISKNTIDESPRAYKNGEGIKDQIQDTLDIVKHLRPIFVFKPGD